jgi:hypothetical protein
MRTRMFHTAVFLGSHCHRTFFLLLSFVVVVLDQYRYWDGKKGYPRSHSCVFFLLLVEIVKQGCVMFVLLVFGVWWWWLLLVLLLVLLVFYGSISPHTHLSPHSLFFVGTTLFVY